MTSAVTIRAAEMPRDLPAVQDLCWAYRDHLRSGSDLMRDLTEVFYPQDVYAKLMDDLPQKYSVEGTGVVLAVGEDGPFGCGMYHGLNAKDAEIKRVFVTETGRGKGVGKALSDALITRIRADGYRRILLDTNPDFTAARRVYEALGFKQRGPYSEMPDGVAELLVYYELTL